MTAPFRIGAALAATALLGAACGSDRPDPSAARAALEPHRVRFSDYDRWARRTLLADAELRAPRSLEETLFAPIRRQDELLGVQVTREGAMPLDVSFPEGFALPDEVAWLDLADPQLGQLRVALVPVPDPRADGDAPAIVVRRERGAGAATVAVSAAYRRAAPAAEP